MSNSKKTDINFQLITLQKNFKGTLSGRIEKIQHLWNFLQQESVEPLEKLHEIHLQAHSLAGSGGTFGAVAVSKMAKALEEVCKEVIDNVQSFESARSIIQTKLDKLHQVASDWEPNDVPYIAPQVQNQYTQEFNNLIYVVDDDLSLLEELRTTIEGTGYEVQQFTSLSEFQLACDNPNPPGAIIMDMVFSQGSIAGAETIQSLNHKWTNMPPVIFMSVRDDAEARLATVQAGASRYFVKPLDFKKLTQTLDGLTRRMVSTPYRVLIVDDDEDVLNHNTILLRGVGLEVKALSDPMQVLTVMDTFQPELLLLDVYMPVCSGLELASMVRQDDAWSQLPIVFLSAESDRGQQLAAINLGGDDFITKPVDNEHLISAVMARLKRSRWVARLNRELRETLKQSEYQRIALDQHGIVSITDPQGKITSVNDKFCKASGYNRSEIIGMEHRVINSKYHPKEFFEEMWASLQQGQVWHGELCNKSKSGNDYWLDTTIVPFLDDDGVPYQYVEVSNDISEMKNTQVQLQVAKEAAENANRAKSEFLSNMSHELRTPLNAILGFSQLLQIDKQCPLVDMQLQSVIEIEKGGNHLLELINEILDLARIEAGRVDLSIEAIAFKDLQLECEALIDPLLTKYQIEWGNSRGSCEAMVVRADYTRLKQVLLNLLSNACKYNKTGGQVNIECENVDDDRVRIMVSDSGKGIPEEKLKELYKPFNRLGAENSDIEGSGIGLVVTKQLVELMGGTVGVESKVGHGSTFWLELPKDTLQPSKVMTEDETETKVDLAVELESKKNILYIEDNPANLRLVTIILGGLSHINLRSAHEPLLGLDLAEAHQPDLILLDINLPGMDGYQVLQRLQNGAKTKNIPVVAVSANAMQRDINRGMEAGFIDYITKPINVEKFIECINSILSKTS